MDVFYFWGIYHYVHTTYNIHVPIPTIPSRFPKCPPLHLLIKMSFSREYKSKCSGYPKRYSSYPWARDARWGVPA
jgi:hypothetical protein